MDALRLAINSSMTALDAEVLHKSILSIRDVLSTRYSQWKSSCISIATYLSLVGSVSVYDIVLTVLYAPYLKYAEQNPIGRWMMDLDHLKLGEVPDLTLFLTLKSLGTAFVLSTLFCLIRWQSKFGHPVALGVTLAQVLLALYLTFGTTAT